MHLVKKLLFGSGTSLAIKFSYTIECAVLCLPLHLLWCAHSQTTCERMTIKRVAVEGCSQLYQRRVKDYSLQLILGK